MATDERAAFCFDISSAGVDQLLTWVYPSLYPVHDPSGDWGKPDAQGRCAPYSPPKINFLCSHCNISLNVRVFGEAVGTIPAGSSDLTMLGLGHFQSMGLPTCRDVTRIALLLWPASGAQVSCARQGILPTLCLACIAFSLGLTK